MAKIKENGNNIDHDLPVPVVTSTGMAPCFNRHPSSDNEDGISAVWNGDDIDKGDVPSNFLYETVTSEEDAEDKYKICETRVVASNLQILVFLTCHRVFP